MYKSFQSINQLNKLNQFHISFSYKTYNFLLHWKLDFDTHLR